MRTRSILAALAALALAATPVFAAGPFAQVDSGSSSIDFRPTVSGVSLTLTVSGPDDFLFQKTFGAGDTASFGVFDASGDFLPEGSYTWRLEAAPELTDAQRDAMADLRAGGASAAQKAALRAAGYEPMSGSFAIAQGAIVAGGEIEPGQNPAGGNRLATKATVLATNDGVIRQSLCVGIDCPNSPVFGFDTLRLQENNTRLNFEDTSVGTFPTTDWTIVANDSANGGQNYLAFQEDDAGTLPFKVRNGAGNNALYVHTNGDVGLGTGTPVLNLHIVDGDSPAIRLEQNNSSGFTPQTWDIAGNEANFFIRDVTNGSQLPFKIQPGADSNSLVVASDNDVGVGVLNASASLHVRRSDGTAQVFVEEASGTAAARTLFNIENNGQVKFRMNDTAQAPEWVFTASNAFQIDNLSNVGVEFQINPNGEILQNGAQIHAPDYVFEPDYELLTLAELRSFIETNKHLPNVPSALEIQTSGLNLTRMPLTLLEKIEELALYILDQDEEISSLRDQLGEKDATLESLAADLAEVKSTLEDLAVSQH